MAELIQLDTGKLKNLENAAAGHDGLLSDESGELVIKPCTQAEIDFYQDSLTNHPKFYELMPTFMGTLALNPIDPDANPATTLDPAELARSALHGAKLNTQTAIVLENLEHGFQKPNVLDLKLGAKLYADGTRPDKAERLDKVAAETTSGSLHFRIAGMKVWNGQRFDIYDKMYGRGFRADNVQDGFATFFSGLSIGNDGKPADNDHENDDDAHQLLETVLADITKARHSLERSESRMFSASLLIVYEGDPDARNTVLGRETKTPRVDELAPTRHEIQESEEAEEEDDEIERPVTHRVKMIDFAHATWTPGLGPDENVIQGLKNIEDQMDLLIARFEQG